MRRKRKHCKNCGERLCTPGRHDWVRVPHLDPGNYCYDCYHLLLDGDPEIRTTKRSREPRMIQRGVIVTHDHVALYPLRPEERDHWAYADF